MPSVLKSCLFGAAGLALAGLSTAPAEAGVRWGKCGAPTRVAGKGVACSNGFAYPFTVTKATETWVATLMTPLNQCAPLTFTLEVDGVRLKKTEALAAGKRETVVLGTGLKPGPHTLTVKSMFMFSECFPEDPPFSPGNWGVDTKISTQP